VAFFSSRDSVVGIATDYGLDDRGVEVRVPVGKNYFLSTFLRPVLGPTQPTVRWMPGVKRSERETDHSPKTSAELKKKWVHTSTPPKHVYAIVLSSTMKIKVESCHETSIATTDLYFKSSRFESLPGLQFPPSPQPGQADTLV
jgi:hypothetical protein